MGIVLLLMLDFWYKSLVLWAGIECPPGSQGYGKHDIVVVGFPPGFVGHVQGPGLLHAELFHLEEPDGYEVGSVGVGEFWRVQKPMGPEKDVEGGHDIDLWDPVVSVVANGDFAGGLAEGDDDRYGVEFLFLHHFDDRSSYSGGIDDEIDVFLEGGVVDEFPQLSDDHGVGSSHGRPFQVSQEVFPGEDTSTIHAEHEVGSIRLSFGADSFIEYGVGGPVFDFSQVCGEDEAVHLVFLRGMIEIST